jgi:alpha-L-rhamnosidase
MYNSSWITGGKVFKKDFKASPGVVTARLSITAKGVYEARLNGKRVGDFILAPGFTSYNKRHQYQEYDITDMLSGDNELTVYVGDGWYAGRLAWWDNAHIYGDKTAIIAKIELKYADGTVIINTDESWLIGNSPITFDSIYDGETYDVRIVPEFTAQAQIYDAPKSVLVEQEGDLVTEHEVLSPLAFITTPKGERVVDFGQNLTGYVELTVTADGGEKIQISHAEILDADGNFYTDNYRTAKSQINYICKAGEQTYKPRFTFMGFRYIRLDECPIDITLKAIAVHSDMKRTGLFDCSNALVNKLFENTIWGQKGNFLDIPTDCPQRDERLGWTGDAQVFVKAASYNFDVHRFFRKWLSDLAADQRGDGSVPHVVPDVLSSKSNFMGGSAAWGDAAVVCPWQLYLTYGDKQILARQFESMRKWVKYSLQPGREHYGDWLGLDAPYGSYKGSSRDEYINAAYNAYSTGIFIKAGKLLGIDMTEYEELYERIISDFNRDYKPETQTEHVLALHFDLVKDKKKCSKDLADMIIKNGSTLQTGFVGTPYLLHALSDNGYAELAYTLLLRRDYPSWLYPITKGATTIWEHWDGIKPDGTLWSTQMNSYNHYAYGSVVDWLYGVAAGIRIDESAPAFAHILIEPVCDKRLSHLGASIDTKYGRVSSKWEIVNGKARYEIEVPSSASITIDGKTHNVGKGVYRF